MNVAAPDPFTLILWGAAALVAAGVCLPMVLVLLGFSRVEITPIAGPEAAAPDGADPQYAELYDRLRDLGFEPQAVRVEKCWFFLWYWRRTSLPGPVFVRPGRDCFATMYRLYRGDPWRLTFWTILTDGTLVATADGIERLRIDRPGYYRRGYRLDDPAELLRLHEEAVADFRERGATVAAPDLAEAHEVAARRTEEHMRESGKGQAFRLLQKALICLAVGPLAVVFWLGYDHWGVPLALIGCGVVYELLMPTTIRTGAQSIRWQEQSNALASRWAWVRRMRAAEQAARRPGWEDSLLAEDQPGPSPEAIRPDPPPRPPTDFTGPTG